MLSYALATGTHLATNYFHLPFDEEEDQAIENYERKYITWVAQPTTYSASTTPTSSNPSSPKIPPASLSSSSSSDSLESAASSSTNPEPEESPEDAFISTVINESNLYTILGVPNTPNLDKLTLRRAYLSRSRACHPDKFPENPLATEAFQRVAVAYDVLSTPDLRRRYDSILSFSASSPACPYDVFTARRPTNYAEETLKSVILGVFNDFLDGDLEVIRSLLNGVNEFNPGIKLGDEGINSILTSLHAIRERALTCRTCIYTLHTELTRLLETQHAFSQLSYFDILTRTRLTIQLTRITVGIPVALEKALLEKSGNSASTESSADSNNTTGFESTTYTAYNHDRNGGTPGALDRGAQKTIIFPRHAIVLIRGLDAALDKMERVLK